MTCVGAVIPATRCFIAVVSGPFRAASILSAGVGVWAKMAIADVRQATRIFIDDQYTPPQEQFVIRNHVREGFDGAPRGAYTEGVAVPRSDAFLTAFALVATEPASVSSSSAARRAAQRSSRDSRFGRTHRRIGPNHSRGSEGDTVRPASTLRTALKGARGAPWRPPTKHMLTMIAK